MARPGLDKNVKFKHLIRLLGLPRPQVRGLLETMWDVANECGNPILGDQHRVEAAAEWYGESGVYFDALRQSGMIDQTASGLWTIHDYWDHAPEYVRKRRDRELQRIEKGERLESTADNGGQRRTTAPNGQTPSPSPSHLIPLSPPSEPTDTRFDERPRSNLPCDNPERTPAARAIAQHYQSVVRPGHPRGRAVENVIGLLNLGHTEDRLQKAADRYASVCDRTGKDRKHRLSASTFYSEAGSFEEFLTDDHTLADPGPDAGIAATIRERENIAAQKKALEEEGKTRPGFMELVKRKGGDL